MPTTIHFGGSIPKNYDDYLGPLLFESFALELAGRVEMSETTRTPATLGKAGEQPALQVLELACGTGRLTRHLLECLPQARLTATDLNADMLTLAMEKVTAANLSWTTADMQSIPFKDESFDWVVCQFGVMLVPDRLKALTEVYRVLKKGGSLIYNVWGDLDANPFWQIGADVVAAAIGEDPIRQDPGPFTMQKEQDVALLMEKAGFTGTIITPVKQSGTIEQAAMAAKGFIQGLPVYKVIEKKNPALLEKIEQTLEKTFRDKLGDAPMQTELLALVVEGKKRS